MDSTEYVNSFIRQHSEYFARNATQILNNRWDNLKNYEDTLDKFTNQILDLKEGEDSVQKAKKLKELEKEVRVFVEASKKTKDALFKSENKLTNSILGRLVAFITDASSDRGLPKTEKFILDTVAIIEIHLKKCKDYLNYTAEKIGEKEIETDDEIEFNQIEVLFQDTVFNERIKIENILSGLNINNSSDNLQIKFHNNKKAPLVMREPLCLSNDDVKEKTNSLSIEWSLSTSKEMFINMREQDIPKWNSKKHYFEQDPVVLQFWTEEYNKIKNGITIGGYRFSGWFYFHLNFFRTPIPQQDGSEPNTQPGLRDNDFFFEENLKACISLEYPDYYSKAMLIYGTRRFGKALRDDQHLYHTDGSIRPIGQAKVGDKIFGSDGKPTNILGVYPQGEVELYEVTMGDGRKSICCSEHLWTVFDYQARKYKVLPLKEIMNDGWSYERNRAIDKKEGISTIYKYFIPVNKAVEYDFNIGLEIDPYYLGLWLGDGSARTTGVTTMDEETIDYLESYAKKIGMTTRHETKKDNLATTVYIKGGKGKDNKLFSNLRENKLIKNKHIPIQYLMSSVEDRMSLLQGLMDTDGTISKGGSDISYVSADEVLAKDVLELVRSLGIHANIKKYTGNYIKKDGELNTYYKILMYTDKDVFRLKRKLSRLDKSNVNRIGKIERVPIVDIKKVDSDKATCIRVDNKSKEFLTNDFIVTHNSVILASLAHWRTLTKFNSFGSIIGGNSSDINSLTSKIKTSMSYIDAPFRLEIIKQNWENGETTFGIKEDASSARVFSTLIVQNLEAGTAKKSQTTAGLAPSVSIYDEIGKYSFLKPYLAALPSFKTPYGFKCITVLAGTGGEADLSMDAMDVLSNPEVYDLLPMNWDLLENNIDPEFITWERKTFATFFPGQMAYEEGFIKKDMKLSTYLKKEDKGLDKINIGVTDWKKNTEYLKNKAEKAKKTAGAKGQLLHQQIKVQYPLHTNDCFLSSAKNIFNAEEARKRKEYLEQTGEWDRRYTLHRGYDGKITKEISNKPLAEYPHKGGHIDAPFLIFQDFPDYKAPMYEFILGLDDYKQEDSDTDSVGTVSVYKYDLFGDKWAYRLVASYAARPEKHSDFHKNVLMLAEAYNARIFMENEDTGFITYLERLHLEEQYLVPHIDFTSNLEYTINGRRKYGWTPAQSKKKILNLYASYLNDGIKVINEEGLEVTMDRIHGINDIGLLEEMINYKPDNNVDRIIASMSAVAYIHYLITNHIHPKRYIPQNVDTTPKERERNPYSSTNTGRVRSAYSRRR